MKALNKYVVSSWVNTGFPKCFDSLIEFILIQKVKEKQPSIAESLEVQANNVTSSERVHQK